MTSPARPALLAQRARRAGLAMSAAALVFVSCSASNARETTATTESSKLASTTPTSTMAATSTTSSAPQTSAAPITTTTVAVPRTTATTRLDPSTTTAPPPPVTSASGFNATINRIDTTIARRMTGVSWRPACPVPLTALRYLRLTYRGFDGRDHIGELVVHSDAATTMVDVFRTLYVAKFPIARMQLVDDYGADDDRSTLANNTSAFNCRAITGGTAWSQHSYGRAIDINPVQNPYVYRDGHVLDPNATPFVRRSPVRNGMITSGDVVTTAFATRGWKWGGNFNSFKDYQHFSATGG